MSRLQLIGRPIARARSADVLGCLNHPLSCPFEFSESASTVAASHILLIPVSHATLKLAQRRAAKTSSALVGICLRTIRTFQRLLQNRGGQPKARLSNDDLVARGRFGQRIAQRFMRLT